MKHILTASIRVKYIFPKSYSGYLDILSYTFRHSHAWQCYAVSKKNSYLNNAGAFQKTNIEPDSSDVFMISICTGVLTEVNESVYE